MELGREFESSRARSVAIAAVQALGSGFDVTTDYQLKYCKRPLVELDKQQTEDILLPGGILIPNVSQDVRCDEGERKRFTSDVLQFEQMSELFNKNASIQEKIPHGFFNAMYDFSGSWLEDAMRTKSLALDGWFITLYSLQLTRSPLVLQKEVKEDIPSTWHPEGLARFIEKYGTHIVVSVSIGGQDVLYLKQNHSSFLSAKEIHEHLKGAGDNAFADVSIERSLMYEGKENKKVPDLYAFNSQAPHTQVAEDMVIISRRRGGDVFLKTHSDWQETVNSSPDAISMSFIPITSLLSGVPGSGFLLHAINLYLRYKPPVEDIQHFLEFQVPKEWVPVYCELPLRLLKQDVLPYLRFSLMGPKLYINSTQVTVDKKPVTGVRLYLEGSKNNRLAIHLHHLSSLPRVLQQFWNDNVSVEQPRWNGSGEAASKWFKPVRWKSFSHVCTLPIKYCPEWLGDKGGAFVVTGAQLEVKVYGLRNVLHLKLLFTGVPGCTIQKSRWDQPRAAYERSEFVSASRTKTTFSSIKRVISTPGFFDVQPKPVRHPKLSKFVDTTELTTGPQDMPGHWLVTAAQLQLDRGKISLRVKYSLLNYN